jgi:replicative DNA helicase
METKSLKTNVLSEMPVSDKDTETAILYCLIHFPIKMHPYIGVLTADDFYTTEYQEILDIFKEAYKDKTDASRVMPIKFKDYPCWTKVTTHTTFEYEIDTIFSKLKTISNLRKIQGICYGATVKAKEKSDPYEIRHFMNTALDSLYHKLEESIEQQNINVEKDFNEKILEADGYSGLTTGFHKLDALTRGLCGGTMTIVAGTPSVGKTTFILNILNHICGKLGKKAIYVSMEMDYTLLQAKLVAELTGIPIGKILATRKNLSEEEYQDIFNSMNTLRNYKLIRLGRNETTISDIEIEIKKAGDVDVVFIDYLQLISPESKTHSRYEEISMISRRLKKMSLRLNIPVVVVASINRAYAQAVDKKPQISHLRDSGNIEYDADGIWLLHRESTFREADEDEDKYEFEHKAELIIGKNRYGVCNKTLDLFWDGDKSKFTEVYNQ